MKKHNSNAQLQCVYGIGEKRAEQLQEYGIDSCVQLASADVDRVMEALSVSEKTATELITGAKTTVGYYE